MENGLSRLEGSIRRAVDTYDMIAEGETVCVGLSGGKDSLSLLSALVSLSRYYPRRFSVAAIHVDMGFPGYDTSPLSAFCDTLGVPLHIAHTDIAKIVFDIRKEENPCSLCANLRRGALCTTAAKLGYPKLALGHHRDDITETLLLNLFYEGRLGVFPPVTVLNDGTLTLIRPFLYTPEKDILYYARHAALPVVKNPCPADGNTEREAVKKLLSELERTHKGTKHRIFRAIEKAELDGYRLPTKNGTQ